MTPEEVFRFVNVRPVQQAPDDRVLRGFAAYDRGGAKSPFHQEVERLEGPDARQQAAELARARLAVDDDTDADLKALLDAVEKATGADDVEEATERVEDALGERLDEYLQGETARRLKDSLWDRLYAHTLVPEAQPERRESVYGGVRALHYLELLGALADDDKPLTRAELASVTPTIPAGLVPGSPEGERDWEERYAELLREQLNAVYGQVVVINASVDDLRNADRRYQAEQLRSQPPQEAPVRSPAAPAAAGREPPEQVAEQRVVTVLKKAPWVFEEFGQRALGETTKELLVTRRTALAELEVAEVVASLLREKYELAAGFVTALPAGAAHYLRDSEQFELLLRDAAVPWYQTAPVLPVVPAPEPGSASARGIQPLGIGDLLVVRQELTRYAAGEVAHIENVLKSEFKTRMHARLREVEEILVTETEQLEETEKDLQTTERFELHKEAQRTIESQMSLEAGVQVTASYGPVSVAAHADFALSQSTSESNSVASTFARQVTERSVSRIMQRVREERTRRTLERFEERNEHGFDNKTGGVHVIGIYRWVDKYYQARLVNYGRRLMFEFIIPEPAAFYLHLQAGRTLPGVTLKRPKQPMASGRRLEPTDLTQYNFTDYVAEYNVQDAEPYPAEVVRVSAAFAEASGASQNTDYAKTSEKLIVPPGYKCYDVFGELGWQGYGSNYFLECFVAGQQWGSVTAAGLEGVIPISVKGWVSAFHINVVAICELKPETRKAWQLRTYAAIMSAYERALADYNEQVASAQIQAGVQIEGRNPALNRSIERDELTKGALRLLTNDFARTRVGGVWRFDELFDAMQPNGQFGYPEFDVDESIVEGRMLQFFEQAFEWQNLTYRFYPYFWGRKDAWDEIFPLTDVDAQFTEFLRAGAARVVVPVHPAYNEAILYYLATNEIWNGGSPPTLEDPLFISIVDELKADSGAELDEELPECAPDSDYPCRVDEWEVKLPTTLVYLQQDASLPDFTTP